MHTYSDSNFKTYDKFLIHASNQYLFKGSDYYKNLNTCDGPPPVSTFKNWFKAKNKRSIYSQSQNTNKKARTVKNPRLDDMVFNYIVKAENKLSEFGLGLSWSVVQSRALQFAKQLHLNGLMNDEDFINFRASRGWIEKLKRRKKLSVSKLLGEANTLSPAVLEAKITEFRDELLALMNEHDVDSSHVFNADQTGLYYRRFPCTTIVSADRKQFVKGTKAMKDKDRITAMVCTSSTGAKVPIAFVGKAKTPHCCFWDCPYLQNYTSNNKTLV